MQFWWGFCQLWKEIDILTFTGSLKFIANKSKIKCCQVATNPCTPNFDMNLLCTHIRKERQKGSDFHHSAALMSFPKNWIHILSLQKKFDILPRYIYIHIHIHIAASHYEKRLPDITLTIGNSCIKPSQTIWNLGAYFESNMTMASHITNVSRTITFHLRNILRIRRFIDKDACHHAVRSLILSRLDYCNGLLSSLPKSYSPFTASTELGCKTCFYCE